jgi:hypothetical protein
MSESSHPCAAVQCLFIPETQELWVVSEYREKQILPETFAAAILRFQYGGAPCAWGMAENQSVGAEGSYADLYRSLGVNMLGTKGSPIHAVPVGLDLGYSLMDAAAIAGKLKIDRSCRRLLEEWSMLERDETTNKPVAIMDDLLSALRYAFLMAPKYSRPEYRFRDNTGLTRSSGNRHEVAAYSQPGQLNVFTGEPEHGNDIDDIIAASRRR